MYDIKDLHTSINFSEFNETLDVKDFKLTHTDSTGNKSSGSTLSLASIVIAITSVLALIAVIVGLLYWKRFNLWERINTEETTSGSIANDTESPDTEPKEKQSSSTTSQYRQ
jgi:hypothetical protein